MLGYVSICAEEGARGAGFLPNGNQAPLVSLLAVLFGQGNCFAGWFQVLSCSFVISPCLNIRPSYSFTLPEPSSPLAWQGTFDYRNALHMLRQTEVSLCNMSLQSVDGLSHHRLNALLVLSPAPLAAHLLGRLLSGPRWSPTPCCCHWFPPPWLLLGHSPCPQTRLPHWLPESRAPLTLWTFLCRETI